jgi:hypothetical protein
MKERKGKERDRQIEREKETANICAAAQFQYGGRYAHFVKFFLNSK